MLPSFISNLDVAMNLGEPKAVHPFFTKPKDIDCQTSTQPQDHFGEDENHTHLSDADYEDSESTPVNNKSAGSSNSRRRKRSESSAAKARSRALLENFARKTVTVPADSVLPSDLPRSTQQTNEDAPKVEEASVSKNKKRRKLEANNGSSAVKENAVEPSEPGTCHDSTRPPPSPLAWRRQLEVAAHTGGSAVVAEDSKQVNDDVASPSPDLPPAQHDRSETTQDVPSKSSVETSLDSTIETAGDLTTRPPKTPPKKMLRLRATGKFSSPVSNLTSTESATATDHQKAKPKQTGERSKRVSHHILVIKYGFNGGEQKLRMGKRIDQIILSNAQVEVSDTKARIETKKIEPPKVTHPFFLGGKERVVVKPASPPPTSMPKKSETRSPRKAAVTLGKLRSEAISSLGGCKSAAFGSTFNRPTSIKHPGSHEAPWPNQGIVHARGILDGDELYMAAQKLSLDARKAKGVPAFVPFEEDLLQVLAARLGDLPFDFEPDENKFPPPPVSVRLPERLITTGDEIRSTICRELHDLIDFPAEEPMIAADQWTEDIRGHPALLELLKSLDTVTTAFDSGTCETRAWTQKYAPTQANQVLQTPKSMSVLRAWFSGLTVQSVEGASNESVAGSKKNKTGKPAKKRRKKINDLDDFIVSSEDDDGDMDELSEPEDQVPSPSSRQRGKKSLIRTMDVISKNSRKLKNMVMISGPPGCGKTAAVYAVAKELQFDVFEINPGSRRSGKDILEKVGDMTENHLVNNGHKDPASTVAIDSDAERATEAFQKDIASGRQGTMTSFFQAKPARTKKPATQSNKSKRKSEPGQAMKQLENSLKPRRNQKQSLILLEEVDVLFEEDKAFWSTVIELALQSKRPIVMTCNNEDIVPMDDISFEAILRFSTPPENLATGYLLAMAAREGHLVEREAISQLYRSKSGDLRATITELNFWCQMGVGDRRGGLDWIYQRCPPGKDVDHKAKKLRVASKGTYEAGMGWLNHDLTSGAHLDESVKEELQLELWQNWHIDPLEIAVDRVQNEVRSGEDASAKLDQLRLWEIASEGQSAADVFCRVGLPLTRPAAIDTTQPALKEKSKLSYECGYPLLQTEDLIDYQNIDTKIAATMALEACRFYVEATPASLPHGPLLALVLSGELESTCINIILQSKASAEERPVKLAREDFITTFEPISSLPPNVLQTGSPNSSFDRPLSIITKDLAPYVRSISASDMRLESERMRLSNILSIGGRQNKRMRTTRASRSALGGGKRETTRRERWFYKTLNLKAVMGTAGESWAAMGTTVAEHKDGSEIDSEMTSSPESANSPPA